MSFADSHKYGGMSPFGPAIAPPRPIDPMQLISDSDQPRWYLAYGSNMSAQTFRGRRGIKPLDEKTVIVPGLELTFDLPTLPYIEPRAANCRIALEPVDVDTSLRGEWDGKGNMIGVTYLVTAADFRHIVATEGAGTAYQMVLVNALVMAPDQSRTGEIIPSYTLLAPVEKTRAGTYGQPSLRYLNLLRTGAREHSLPSAYITYLENLKHYQVTTLKQHIGRATFVATWAPLLLALLLLMQSSLDNEGRAPSWVERLRVWLFHSMWGSYDRYWKKVWGDGERTVLET